MSTEECLEDYLGEQWVEATGGDLCRGRLIEVNLPHAMPEQATLRAEGRLEDDPGDHSIAQYKILRPFRINDVRETSRLPVAGLPDFSGEVYLVQRAKIRPAIVMGHELSEIPRGLRTGETKRWTHPTCIVAPSFGVPTNDRVNDQIMDRFRRCEYPNYFYTRLPRSRYPSVVRFDQLQPIGSDYRNYRLTDYRLSDEFLECLDDWMTWLFSGVLPDGDLDDIRTAMLDDA